MTSNVRACTWIAIALAAGCGTESESITEAVPQQVAAEEEAVELEDGCGAPNEWGLAWQSCTFKGTADFILSKGTCTDDRFLRCDYSVKCRWAPPTKAPNACVSDEPACAQPTAPPTGTSGSQTFDLAANPTSPDIYLCDPPKAQYELSNWCANRMPTGMRDLLVAACRQQTAQTEQEVGCCVRKPEFEPQFPEPEPEPLPVP